MRLASIAVVGCLVAALQGCASTPRGQSDLLSFLEPGSTTREAAIVRLGTPNLTYEGGRILTYWVNSDEGGLYTAPLMVTDWPKYSLVLVFRSDGLLERHALVAVRGR
jgi:hypothetical protein